METEKTIQKLQEYLLQHDKKITEGPELNNDISYKWVAQN